MDGVWVQPLAAPWPDDFPVDAWRHNNDASFSTLGQVRSASPGIARPVSLVRPAVP